MIALGLMSGTSLDGIDAALVEIRPRPRGYAIDLREFITADFSAEERERLRVALPPNAPDARALAELHFALGRAFARAGAQAAGSTPIDYVASHGLTVYHDGDARVSLQLADPFAVRDRLGASVVYDFRSADCAAGGHGAPLVPYVDYIQLSDPARDIVALNIGGIANVTIMPRGAQIGDVIAFDTGPGNMLIDAFVTERSGGARRYDAGGEFAAAGAVDAALLRAMLDDPYFAKAAPKSTGREYFGAQFPARFAPALSALALEDGAATLTALSAHSIGAAVRANAPASGTLIAAGGGVENATLLAMLSAQLPGYAIERSDAGGLRADAKEAIAFAILGYETLRGRPAGLPRVTGARHAALLGAVAPRALGDLLAKVAAEVARSAQA